MASFETTPAAHASERRCFTILSEVHSIGNSRPKGLGDFASRVYVVLEEHVVSPWHLLASTCGWHAVDPLQMSARDLEHLIPSLGDQVAKVTNETHALHLMHALQNLVRESKANDPKSA